MTGVGIGNVQESNLKVYPVPATDFINIEGAEMGNIIDLTNILGQAMTTLTATGLQQNLNMKTVAPGTYPLVLTRTDGSRNTIRIMKQ